MADITIVLIYVGWARILARTFHRTPKHLENTSSTLHIKLSQLKVYQWFIWLITIIGNQYTRFECLTISLYLVAFVLHQVFSPLSFYLPKLYQIVIAAFKEFAISHILIPLNILCRILKSDSLHPVFSK